MMITKKMYRKKPSFLILLIAFIMGIALGSCDRTRMDKGYEYFPDMAHGPAYKTYSENPAMADGKTMREPVAGTVPVDFIPYAYPADADGREAAGRELHNPLRFTEKISQEGETLYNVFCSNCHGIQGDGMGNLFTDRVYVIPPSSLIDEDARNMPSGEIYHVISAGWGVMGPHKSLIRPDERWKIINYVEEVLQAQ